jgi:hypothetical protein
MTNDYVNYPDTEAEEPEELSDEIMKDLEDLDERSRACEEANQLYEKLAYLAVQKMPCPECGGAGAVSGGSLGGACPNCLGTRVVNHPGAEVPEMPDFAGFRQKIRGAREARQKALPMPTDVPSLAMLKNLITDGTATAKELAGPSAAPAVSLPAPREDVNLLGSLGHEGDEGLREGRLGD